MSKSKNTNNMYDEEAVAVSRKKKISIKNVFGEFRSWLLLIFIAIITGYAFVTFFFQTVTVIGPSMSDTLQDGEIVIINKFEYRIHDVKRYDVVAYKMVDSEGYFDIKRVYGMPGETVTIEGGKIYINGEELTDRPVSENILTPGIAQNEIVLGKDEYFVLGDNINNSEDSRFSNVGNITDSEIKGKVCYVIGSGGNRRKVK